jgi:hypothetical protein
LVELQRGAATLTFLYMNLMLLVALTASVPFSESKPDQVGVQR